jgi:hypothetical protein
MAKIQHPWQVGPTELIEFALERLHTGSDVDRRLAFLILDVGVETLFKTYLTLPSSVVQYQTNRKERDNAVNGNFHDLLDGVDKSNPEKAAKFNFAHIQHYHKLRNMLYHEGNQVTAVPMHQLEGYATLAVNLLKTYLEVDLSKILKPTKKATLVSPTTSSIPTDQEKMLSKCTPEAAKVFQYVLQSAAQQGHIIYWGVVGFSIRTRLPGSADLATIFYGFPPNKFQVYFAHLPFPEKQISALREQILQLGTFRQAPKTLTINVKADNIQQAKEAYLLMERRVKELSAS